MAKNSPEIDRLLTEFKAQDHGVQLVVVVEFDRIIAAKFSEGNQNWELTPAGKNLLDPPQVPEESTLPPTAQMPGAQPGQRNLDVRIKKA